MAQDIKYLKRRWAQLKRTRWKIEGTCISCGARECL